ncbi:hypothetical protein RQM59_04530 [Flavobacteriaceae bacterium S356]|uniref:DUF4350 domain-containing protein n=1 Tax=Asprobacillus argus TaxID=3076534 RepID=A0ABU3LDJ3_9FLAO|nr:hypothetical protein [Flavobacteriaceae bacterium S356]
MICKKHIYILFLIAITSIFSGCKETDWYENYKVKNKSPFGTYIVYNELSELFYRYEVKYLEKNIVDYLREDYISAYDEANYVCINNHAPKINGGGIAEILEFVKEGNDAFFSLNYYNEYLKEALEIDTENLDFSAYNIPAKLKLLEGDLYLKNNDFLNQPYSFDRNLRRNYFTSYNSKNTIVLGTQEINGTEEPIFLKIYHGKGAIYLHTQPIVFTNYYMLSGREKYAEDLLSYLPNRETIWDPQIRSSTDSDGPNRSESVFSFFWRNSSLKWFLYVSFFGLLLFMIFNARRKQRPIPIISASKNSTVEFTHTISNLYLKNDNHKSLVDKKIQFFLEKVRTKYLIDTNNLNNDFMERLALKSGNKLRQTKYLINTIIALNKKQSCSEEDLIGLHKMIENFLKRK